MIPSDHPLADAIRALIPINGLEPWLHDEIFAQGELVACKKRAVVFKEGDDDPFSYFIVEGSVELSSGDQTPRIVNAGEGDALRALAQLRPRRYTAKCTSAGTMFRIKRAVLEHILSDEQVSKESGGLDAPQQEDPEGEDDDWMSRLLNSALLTRLPPNHIQRFFAELEPVSVDPQEHVVEQGGPGDYLYIVAEGRFEVIRKLPGGLREQQLAVLHAGAVFGEEALISDLPRNATVRSISGGLVMRLGKTSFEELISKETLRPVPYAEACELVEQGAKWLDARFPEEVDVVAMPGAINIPLNQLRIRFSELDRDCTYVAYCDTGGRGSTAAYLLTREHFDMYYLAGGIEHSPLVASDAGAKSAESPKPAESALTPEAAPTAQDASTQTEAEPRAEDDDPFEMTAADADVAEEAEPSVAETSEASGVSGGESVSSEELSTVLSQLEQERERHEGALNKWREQMRALKADRDAVAAKCEKAIRAAREFKSKLEGAARQLKAQNARLEAAKTEREADKEEAARALELERKRLETDLEVLQGRFKSLLAEHESLREQSKTERESLQAAQEATRKELSEAGERLEALERELSEAQSKASDREDEHREELESVQAKVLVLETENGTAAARIEVLEARFEASRKTIVEQESQLAEAVSNTESVDAELVEQQAEIEALQRSLALEREQLDKERLESERQRGEQDAEQRSESERIKSELENIERRRAEVDERARETEAAFSNLDEELKRRRESHDKELAAQREELDRQRTELTQAKADWDATIEAAVGDERQRLVASRETLEKQAAELEAARESFEQETASRNAELESEREQLASQLAEAERVLESTEEARAASEAAVHSREQALAREQAALAQRQRELEAQSADAVADWQKQANEALERALQAERSLTEQAALFAEKQRQLESEIVQLRGAVPTSAPAPSSTEAPALVIEPDLDLDLDIDDEPEIDVAPVEPVTDDFELTLDEDLVLEEPSEAPPPPSTGETLEDFSSIFVADDDSKGRGEDPEAHRLVSASQLAAIRAKMKEKMAAVRK